jgi:hypothetical protein
LAHQHVVWHFSQRLRRESHLVFDPWAVIDLGKHPLQPREIDHQVGPALPLRHVDRVAGPGRGEMIREFLRQSLECVAARRTAIQVVVDEAVEEIVAQEMEEAREVGAETIEQARAIAVLVDREPLDRRNAGRGRRD